MEISETIYRTPGTGGRLRPLFQGLLGLLACSLFMAGPLRAQSRTVTRGSQQWVQYYLRMALNERTSWLADAGYRWEDGFGTPAQYLVRTGISRALSEKVRIGGGMAHLGFYDADRLARVEFRPYQEVRVRTPFQNIQARHRFRVEERFFNPVDGGQIRTPNTFNFRFRYALVFGIPLWQLSSEDPDFRLLLNLGNELFLNAGGGSGASPFDQNRVLISPTLRFNEHLSLSLTWNMQYAADPAPSSYSFLHVFWLQMRHRIEL